MSISPPAHRGLRSLRIQLWLWIALPATIGLLALSVTELYSHERAMHELVNARAQDQAQAIAALLDAQIVRLQEELIDLVHGMGGDAVVSANPLFPGGLALYSPQDAPLSVYGADWAASPQLTSIVQRARSSSAEILPTTLTTGGGTPMLFVPAVGHDGLVLVGAAPVDLLIQASVERVAPLEPSAQLVLLADGKTVAQVGRVEAVGQSAEGEAVVATTGWRVRLVQPWEAMLSPLLRIGNTVGAVVIVAAAISGLAAFFGLRYLVRPLRRLNAAAVKAGWGDDTLLHQPGGGVAEIEELRLALIRMTEQVRRYQQQLHSYIDAMTLGQEEERKRLARELHDETVQALIVLNQQIELAERELDHAPDRAAERLQMLRPLVTDTMAGLRRQIHALRPLYLEDLGFVPALEALVHQTTQPAGIIGDFEVMGEPSPAISPALEITSFRILQEALHNATTHAHATWVHVELIFQDDGLSLRVEDDGVGFDVPNHPFLLAQQGHFGLLGMHERTQAHGGRLQLQSELGKGTTVEVWLPHQTMLD